MKFGYTTFDLYENQKKFLLTDVMEIHFVEINIKYQVQKQLDEEAAIREAQLREERDL